MSDPMLKLRILVRAELALARIHIQRAGVQAVLLAVALVFALLGLALFNFAGFYALAPRFGPAVGALLMGLVNVVLAAVVIAVSRRAGPSAGEEKLAQQIRDMAYAELSTDVDAAKAEIERISEEIGQIRSGIAALREGLSSGLASMLGLVTRALKHSGSRSR